MPHRPPTSDRRQLQLSSPCRRFCTVTIWEQGMSITRRKFIGTGAAAAAGLTLVPSAVDAAAKLGAPAIIETIPRAGYRI